jgi:hypothetical protein
MVVGEGISWMDALDNTGDAGGDVDALMDWIASPTAFSGNPTPGAPFSDFWKATTTQTVPWQCSGPTLAAADQHQLSPAAAQQECKPQVVPDALWPFSADPAPAVTTQPVKYVARTAGAQQDWLRPAPKHAAAPGLFFSPGSFVPSPSPAVTTAPAGLSYTPQTALTAPPAQATGAVPGQYVTILQGSPSPSSAEVLVWSPSMQPSQFNYPAAGPVSTPFCSSTVQQQWLPPAWTQTASALAAPFEASTGMYAGMCASPYPVSCGPAPLGAFAAGCVPSCGILGGHCMYAPAPGMGYGPPLGLSCTGSGICKQCQYAQSGAQPWQDQSSGCSSGSLTLMQLASASSSSLHTAAAPLAGTACSTPAAAGAAGAGSVAAVLAAAAPGEQQLMRTTTLGRSGSNSCLTGTGTVHTQRATPAAPPPPAPGAVCAGPMGAQPSTVLAPAEHLHAGAKSSAQGAAKGSAQMKPPAPRLVKPSTKVAARAGRAPGGREVGERLHALAYMEGGSKVGQTAGFCKPHVLVASPTADGLLEGDVQRCPNRASLQHVLALIPSHYMVSHTDSQRGWRVMQSTRYTHTLWAAHCHC